MRVDDRLERLELLIRAIAAQSGLDIEAMDEAIRFEASKRAIERAESSERLATLTRSIFGNQSPGRRR